MASGASALFAAAFLLAGCTPEAKQPEPPTQGERQALSDAAEMLDDRPTPTASASPTPGPTP